MYLVLSLLEPGLLSISLHYAINKITKHNINLLDFRWPLNFVALNVFSKIPTQRVGLEQSGPHRHLIENLLVLDIVDIAAKFLYWL